MRRLLVGLVVLGFGCRGPCHSQHRHLAYHPEHHTTTCISTGENTRTCYPVHHPARCSWKTICDLRCSDWDKGQAEAHQEHPPHQTQVTVDPLCSAETERPIL